MEASIPLGGAFCLEGFAPLRPAEEEEGRLRGLELEATLELRFVVLFAKCAEGAPC